MMEQSPVGNFLVSRTCRESAPGVVGGISTQILATVWLRGEKMPQWMDL